MITDADLSRYMKSHHAFRREQVILPNGKLYGEAEEFWQREHVWEPLDARDGGHGPKYHLAYLELARVAPDWLRGVAPPSLASWSTTTRSVFTKRSAT